MNEAQMRQAQRIADAIRRIVAVAPPLSEEQEDRLRMLLMPSAVEKRSGTYPERAS